MLSGTPINDLCLLLLCAAIQVCENSCREIAGSGSHGTAYGLVGLAKNAGGQVRA